MKEQLKKLSKLQPNNVDLAEGEPYRSIVSKTQYDKIRNLIQSGIDEGATLVAGGPDRPSHLDKGYFIKPTIFTDVQMI